MVKTTGRLWCSVALAGALVGAATVACGQSETAHAGAVEMSADDIAAIRTTYEALSDEAQAAMKAAYLDMGVDLAALLGEAAVDDAAATTPPESLLKAVKALDFARTPKTVLAARARLGLRTTPMPDDAAGVTARAEWMHRHVMAGEWEAFTTFMEEHAGDDAEAIYAHVLQSTNQGDPALLPEEVIAIADAAPAELNDWQFDVLSQLLESADATSSSGPLLAKIEAGTALFGPQDPERRRRTARLLAGAGLMTEAYAYLEPLDEARKSRNARVILDHARYHEERGRELGAQASAADSRRTAWDLHCEVTLLEDAPYELRQEALRHAIDLLPEIPPAVATAWLRTVFADTAIGPAALEIVALEAMSIRDAKLDVAQRAQAILTMKEAVETLLDDPDLDARILRVPLRMLTTGLLIEAEAAIKKQAPKAGVPKESELLLRALPDERWRHAIEASLAGRAYRAFVGIAVITDETDLALDLLADGVDQLPDQSLALADDFLRLWELRLNPPPDPRRQEQYFYFGWRREPPSAPLTRGRQRRNLDRLERVVDLLAEIGIETDRLQNTVAAFKACHGKSEAFRRQELVRIFGPIESLAPATAAAMADTMRRGLNGDWRNRQVHEDEGMKRSTTEIDEIIEEGYTLALELIDAAAARDPESWRYAMTKAAIAYDHLQFKDAQRGADFASHNAVREEAFRAFADAAARYGDALAAGRERAVSNVYDVWFNAALGASELSYLTRDDLLIEGSDRDDQITRIRVALEALPPDLARVHIGAFARSVAERLEGLEPEVKPRVVRHAVRVVGTHPAGAPLRRLAELYDDLVRDEVKLRLTVDGSAVVGTDSFGALVTMRYTNSVDRETGGFQRYLQNGVWVMRGNRGVLVDYRDRLEKELQVALAENFEVQAIGFFESMNPSLPVKEAGESGWQEKPIAYLILRATDPSVDHLPALRLDLSFNDTVGPVTLPIVSNTPLVEAGRAPEGRPVRDLEVTQIVDTRSMHDREEDRRITLEVHARGRGIVPGLDALLDGLTWVLPGYAIAEDGIEERPIIAVVEDQLGEDTWRLTQDQLDAHEYATPDDDGLYRVKTERSWLVTYEPTGPAGDELILPTLAAGVEAALVSKQYADLDIVPVRSRRVALERRLVTPQRITLVAAIGVGLIGLVLLWRRYLGTGAAATVVDELYLPDAITPLAAIMTLERLRPRLAVEKQAELAEDIRRIERQHFAPAGEGVCDMTAMLTRWLEAATAGR